MKLSKPMAPKTLYATARPTGAIRPNRCFLMDENTNHWARTNVPAMIGNMNDTDRIRYLFPPIMEDHKYIDNNDAGKEKPP